MVRAVIAMIVLALGVSVALAQPGGGRPGANPQIRREKIKKRIRALRAYTLTEELSLDEQAASKLFPVLSKYDADFEKLLVARADIMRRLKVADDLKDPKAIDKLIDEAVANQRGFWDVEDKRLTELRKILTPSQIARLLIVLPALERRIQNQLKNAIQGGGAVNPDDLGKNPFRGNNKAADFSDDGDDVQPPGKTPPIKQAPQGPRDPCDPFSSTHPCR